MSIRKPFIIKVVVIDIETDQQVREKVVDFSDDKVKSWIISLTYWALNNRKVIEMINISDEK